MGDDQLDQIPHITLAIRSLFILSLTHLYCFIAIGYSFYDTASDIPIVISVTGVVPMVVSSWAN